MPEHLCKPLILRRLDDLFNNRPQEIEGFRAALACGGPLDQIAVDMGIARVDRPFGPEDEKETEPRLLAFEERQQVLTPPQNGRVAKLDEQRHLRDDWFAPNNPHDPVHPGGWWAPQHPPVQEILRNGLLALIGVVQQERERTGDGITVDSYWLCAGPDHGAFRVQVQCFITRSARQVTFLILTPEHLFGQMHHAMDPRRAGSFDNDLAEALKNPPDILVVKPNMHGGTLVKPSFAPPLDVPIR
jgi:hypothetical protein